MALQVELGTVAPRSYHQRLHSGDVIGRRRQSEPPGHIIPATVAKFVQQPESLHPAKRLLDPLSFVRTDRVALMPGRVPIEATVLALGNLWRKPEFPARIHEVADIVAFVCTDGLAWAYRLFRQPFDLFRLLRTPLRLAHRGTHNQTVAILGQNVTQVA